MTLLYEIQTSWAWRESEQRGTSHFTVARINLHLAADTSQAASNSQNQDQSRVRVHSCENLRVYEATSHKLGVYVWTSDPSYS